LRSLGETGLLGFLAFFCYHRNFYLKLFFTSFAKNKKTASATLLQLALLAEQLPYW